MKLMTIEKLDKSRVLVSLAKKDMDVYAISIDKLNLRDAACKETLKEILNHALTEVGINAEKKALLVEAMPHKEGMLILITIDFMKNLRKTYRIKKPCMQPVCRFSDAEGLLSCVEKLKAEGISLLKNSLWQYKNMFYVIFDYACISSRAKAILSEYSLCSAMSLVKTARIKEAGKLIIAFDAIDKLAKSLT